MKGNWSLIIGATALLAASLGTPAQAQEDLITGPEPRYQQLLWSDGSDVYVFGGYNNNSDKPSGTEELNDFWKWDGSAERWSRIVDINSPGFLHNSSGAWLGSEFISFGGYNQNNAALNTTYRWTPVDGWEQLSPATSPSARGAHSVAYDESNSQLVLFGGVVSSTEFNDTHVWNGSTWAQITTQGATPEKRHSMVMAYHPPSQKVILYGGFDNGIEYSDTWEWDGAATTWTKLEVSGPNSTHNGAMAWDPINNYLLYFGGLANNDGKRETWSWDGTDWTQLASTESIPFQDNEMVFDPNLNRMIVHGGWNGSTYRSDMWSWNGAVNEWEKEQWGSGNIDLKDFPDGVANVSSLTIVEYQDTFIVPNDANTPLYLLSSGDIDIDGDLTLSGQNGQAANAATRRRAAGGAGGFAGGLGGVAFNQSGVYRSEPGLGPGGAPASGNSSGADGLNASHATEDDGEVYGNSLLQPLVGGSGGSGEASSATSNGAGGGGGGGAVLLASDTKINLAGRIFVDGGDGGSTGAGHGSGGAVKISAPRIEGNGEIYARNGFDNASVGAGYIRLETDDVAHSISSFPQAYAGPLVELFPDDLEGASINITRVAGNVVVNPPTGDPETPDVTFTEEGVVAIEFTTTGIPIGTVMNVRVTSNEFSRLLKSSPVDATGNASAALDVPAGSGTIQAWADFEVSE